MQTEVKRILITLSAVMLVALSSCTPKYDKMPTTYEEEGYVFKNDTTNEIDTIVRPQAQRLSITFYNDLQDLEVLSISRGGKECFISDKLEQELYRGSDHDCWPTNEPVIVSWKQYNNEFNVHFHGTDQYYISPELMYLTQDYFDANNNFCGEYFIFTRKK